MKTLSESMQWVSAPLTMPGVILCSWVMSLHTVIKIRVLNPETIAGFWYALQFTYVVIFIRKAIWYSRLLNQTGPSLHPGHLIIYLTLNKVWI